MTYARIILFAQLRAGVFRYPIILHNEPYATFVLRENKGPGRICA